MKKTILNIDGMKCGMCEKHTNEAIQENFKVKGVTSSHQEAKTEIISEEPLDEEKLHEVIKEIGYTLNGIQVEEYKKKGFSLFKK